MVMGDIFARFLAESPICVMEQALLENVFAPAKLDAVFQTTAVRQYHRQLLFSTLVELTAQVVCRVQPSLHAAYQQQRAPAAAVQALYAKLSGIEPATTRALVQYTAAAVGQVIDQLPGRPPPLLPGYRVRLLDGNHLSGSDHRLQVLRGTAAGALPGQALVLLDPQLEVVVDVFPCEDGHAQERALLDQVLPVIQRRDLVIADRNFCTRAFLVGLARRQAKFILRQHGRLPWTPTGRQRFCGRSATGRVYEQPVVVADPETGRPLQLRRITVKLNKPTRDGAGELHLLTNLPARVSAERVARLYRKRWRLETAFQELTVHLRCELNTLGYPPAALFAFGVALCSYNVLAAIKAALRGAHGIDVAEAVSSYYLTEEISAVHRGMMIALPPATWEPFQTLSSAALAAQLVRWARGIDLTKYRKHQRGPKKPKAKRPNAQFRHVATARLLPAKRPITRNQRPPAAVEAGH